MKTSVPTQRSISPDSIRNLGGKAFTLIELLVVISLIALIAGLAAPALKTKSASLDTAIRQLMDDMNRARQLAISTRSTVYMIFMPLADPTQPMTELTAAQRDLLANRQLRGYALFSRRSVGSQPGKDEPRYLSDWKELPEGVVISTNKFMSTDAGFGAGWLPMDQVSDIPIPMVGGTLYKGLPYIAFDYTGALTLSENGDVRLRRDKADWKKNVAARAVIPLVSASVVPRHTLSGGKRILDWKPASYLLKAPYDPAANYLLLTNYIKYVKADLLTGRTRIEGGEIQ